VGGHVPGALNRFCMNNLQDDGCFKPAVQLRQEWRAIFGEMGKELLLRGAFVQPKKLLEHGFRFDFPTLESVLRFELGKMKNNSNATKAKK
jgi:hypothetical protein